MTTAITVIIPVYNMEKTLIKCLDSIISQTLKNIEIICIDDGSVDATIDILEDYAHKFSNIVILKQTNQGAGPARNLGIKLANGKYIAFMDADDWYPDIYTLQALYEAAEKNSAYICGGNLLLSIKDKLKNCKDTLFEREGWLDYQEFSDCVWYYRFLYRTDIIRKSNIIFPPYRRFQDPPFMIGIMAYVGRIYTINRLVYVHNVEEKSLNFYSLEKCIDMLKGIRDCLILAKKNKYVGLYEKRICNMLDGYNFPIYCKYAYLQYEAIWHILNEIYDIDKSWLGKIFLKRWTRETLIKYIDICKEENQILKSIFTDKRPIILYGAGFIGKKVLQKYLQKESNILGFAITEEKNITDNIAGYEVKQINEYISYKEKANIIVTILDVQQQKSIDEHLKSMGFANIYIFTYAGLIKSNECELFEDILE